MHAMAFLNQPPTTEIPAVVVLHGSDEFLRSEVLQKLCRQLGGENEEEAIISRFRGSDCERRAVMDELRTVSMWGDRRVVVIENADPFVSENRAELERYLAAPARGAVLILAVKSWAKNTRLTKAVARNGLPIECSELKGAKLLHWLKETAASQHEKQLTQSAAALMVELAGTSVGLLSQELAKLAAYVGKNRRIGEEDVQAVVGGWSVKNAFKMMDELYAGRLNKALELLDRLLSSGEAPQKILGAISFSLRKLTQAVEDARQGKRLKAALADAGVFRNQIEQSNAFLRRIGRPQAEQFLARLLQADLQLKGAARLDSRLILETLLVSLSGRLPVES